MNRHDGSTAYAYPYGEVAEINKSVGPIFTNHAFNHKENEHLAIYPPHSGIPAPVPTTPYVCYTDQATPYPIVSIPFNGQPYAMPCQQLSLDKPIPGVNYVTHGGPIAILLYPHQYPNVCENGGFFEHSGNLPMSYASYPPEANVFDTINSSECSELSSSAPTSMCSSSVSPNLCAPNGCQKCHCAECCDNNFRLAVGERNLFCIENVSRRTGVFVSADARIWGFENPLAQILRRKRDYVCVFHLPNTVYYAKITPHSIKFSCNKGGVAYLIDEAATKTCWESFPSAEEMNNLKKHWFNKCRRNTVYRNVDDAQEINLTNGVVNIMANGKSLDKIALTVGKTKVSSKVENLADRMGYVYLSTLVGHFRASVHFSGSALTVRFHTQIAKLDTYGKLKLGSSSSFHVRSS